MTDTFLPLPSNASPTVRPDVDSIVRQLQDPGWKVTVFNNETNTYAEVVTILMIATGCDAEEAYIETWEIDHYGQCVVHRNTKEDCERAAQIIAKIGIQVKAEPEETP